MKETNGGQVNYRTWGEKLLFFPLIELQSMVLKIANVSSYKMKETSNCN